MSLKAVVTAGGTIESIDDVRLMSMVSIESGSPDQVLTHVEVENISRGGFGGMIAAALAARGIETTLIGRRELIKSIGCGEKQELRLVQFRSFAELRSAIRSEIERSAPRYFFMAAAVSDYSPCAVQGKLSSSADELLLRLRRNPKILDELRTLCGKSCIIAGFKLVSGKTVEELTEIARRQNLRADLDFTVGNDLKEIDFEKGVHPIHIVSRDGRQFHFAGDRLDSAKQLVTVVTSCR